MLRPRASGGARRRGRDQVRRDPRDRRRDATRTPRKVALAIANSPLVKTAIAGEDPNWGRIVMAVGKSGAQADRDRLSIRFGDILVAENGWRAPDYGEADGAAYMKRPELVIARRSRPRHGRRDGLDLRPDAPLHRDQRRLSLCEDRRA